MYCQQCEFYKRGFCDHDDKEVEAEGYCAHFKRKYH